MGRSRASEPSSRGLRRPSRGIDGCGSPKDRPHVAGAISGVSDRSAKGMLDAPPIGLRTRSVRADTAHGGRRQHRGRRHVVSLRGLTIVAVMRPPTSGETMIVPERNHLNRMSRRSDRQTGSPNDRPNHVTHRAQIGQLPRQRQTNCLRPSAGAATTGFLSSERASARRHVASALRAVLDNRRRRFVVFIKEQPRRWSRAAAGHHDRRRVPRRSDRRSASSGELPAGPILPNTRSTARPPRIDGQSLPSELSIASTSHYASLRSASSEMSRSTASAMSAKSSLPRRLQTSRVRGRCRPWHVLESKSAGLAHFPNKMPPTGVQATGPSRCFCRRRAVRQRVRS